MFKDDLDITPVTRRPIRLADATLRAVLNAPLPSARRERGRSMFSVVVVTFNNLALTRLCLGKLIEEDAEIIVVDNASTDGTADYLRHLGESNLILPIFNKTNRGFSAANNQGLAAAGGDFLVLLNNDTIPTAGWLTKFALHLVDHKVGLIGPITNRMGNQQQIDANYRTLGEMKKFAESREGKVVDVDRLAMFCLALRRDTFKKLGPLDEQFELGLFEDDDYVMRARQAGMRVVCAHDIFIHHFSEGSFGELFSDGRYSQLFDANRRKFETKWKTEWKPQPPPQSEDYRAMVAALRGLVIESVPSGSMVLVVSRGDDELISLSGRRASHFPQDSAGKYANFHPADSAAAIEHLKNLSANFFVIPATSLWWLDHYADFRKHLETHGRLVARRDDVGAIYEVQR